MLVLSLGFQGWGGVGWDDCGGQPVYGGGGIRVCLLGIASGGLFEVPIQGADREQAVNPEDRRGGPAGRDQGVREDPVVLGLCKEKSFKPCPGQVQESSASWLSLALRCSLPCTAQSLEFAK